MFKNSLGSTHVLEQLLFSMFSSILTFDFDIIFESLFTLWGPNGLYVGVKVGSEIFLVY